MPLPASALSGQFEFELLGSWLHPSRSLEIISRSQIHWLLPLVKDLCELCSLMTTAANKAWHPVMLDSIRKAFSSLIFPYSTTITGTLPLSCVGGCATFVSPMAASETPPLQIT
eukprot:Blabericola_migrator_1__6626@NODE_3343_length_1843_cov_31_712838_g2074_i1_p2_GENE_NODE_3343_length_1843_cov_31_712838_g2074_i1NODE_3343_length_1843_cov_31_712838_g2074_i1_p2_ORF_typecomplete_len114_score12_33Stork_head/PF10264_9/0_15_NODE_3343_length_1843_cov_31_712838_g2074_i17801121